MINRENDVEFLETVLDLERNVTAVKFIDFKDDYEKLDVPEQKGTMCFLGRKGIEGNHIKADANHVACDYGAAAVGIKEAPISITSGFSYAGCGLYNGKSVARKIVESMKFIKQKIHGIEFGPFREVKNPDLAIIVCNTKQAMLIFQGYAYAHGNPENISFFGNQAMCGDLLSKPFSNNDINLSLFCEGARKYGNFKDNEVGISMPAELFHEVVYGVSKTLPTVANFHEKKAISERLEKAGIDFDIDGIPYGNLLDEYDAKVKEFNEI